MLSEDANRLYRQPPAIGVVTGQDLAVAAWTWQNFNLHPLLIDRAFGLTDNGQLVGSIIFREYNGYNVEFSYYAKGAITAGVVRYMARVALEAFKVERVTFRVRRNNHRLGRQLIKFGARSEGVMWCFYGRERTSRNAAVQYVIFRETLLRLAGPRYMRAKMN